MGSLRRAIAWVVCAALVATGCTQTVSILPRDFDDPAYRAPGSYRVRVKNEEYLVRKFSVTDSTIVVQELLPTDKRYGSPSLKLPLVIPQAQVSSIEQMRNFAGFGVGAAVFFVVGILIIFSLSRDRGYID